MRGEDSVHYRKQNKRTEKKRESNPNATFGRDCNKKLSQSN